MTTTNNYILKVTAENGDDYIFVYDTPDVWSALERFWHEDYIEQLVTLPVSTNWPIDVYAMAGGKVIDTYKFILCTAIFHAFFDHGRTVSGPYRLEQFAEDITRNLQVIGKDRSEENNVTSFFFYMWNSWSKEECMKAFEGHDWQHFWNKWCGICSCHSVYGAAERFYSELSKQYRDLLVKRATDVYCETGLRNH